jgi:cell division protein FtsZ
LVHAGFDEIAAAVRGANTRCLFGYGEAQGDNRAHEALASALKNPLLDRSCLRDEAQNVIVSVSGGSDLTLNEVQILMGELHRNMRDDARLFFGCAVDPNLAGSLTISILGVFESGIAAPEIDVRPYLSSTSHYAQEEPVAAVEQTPELPMEEPVAPYGINGYTAEEPEPEEVAAEEYQYSQPIEESEPEAEPEPEPEPELAPAMTAVRRPLPATRPPFNASSQRQRAEQMQLEPINRGRFEKSEPTIVDGQDLDVPTFLRRKF